VNKHQFNWWQENKLQDGLIDYACIDDIIEPHPFGYSYIFQKKDILYHAFTNFRESIIMDTITNNAIISSIAYKQFDSTKVDIIWYEKNDDTYEMYYQWFKKIGLKTYFDPTDVELNHLELLRVYPNPFTNTAFISIPNLKGYSYKLYIKDLSGKTIRIVENITKEKTEITRDGLPAGLYLLELRGPKVYRGKIIIQ
jgi:hypothetical protein